MGGGRAGIAQRIGAFVALFVVACGGTRTSPIASPDPAVTTSPSSCPEFSVAPSTPPGTTEAHRDLDQWLRILATQIDVDAPLMDDAARDAVAARNQHAQSRYDLGAPLDDGFRERVRARDADFRAEASRGGLFDANGGPIPAEAIRAGLVDEATPAIRRATESLSLRCTPYERAFHRSATDHRFDRNSCSRVRAGELVQRVGRTDDGQSLVRTGYSFGYVREPALGPPLESVAAIRALDAERTASTRFTRGAVLGRAFADLERPYGWGGQGGGLDCSSFVLDVLASFGIPMPRFSGDQADAGSYRLDIPAELPDDDRRALLDRANRHGLVLVHFPGHVMLYLGRDDAGTQMAIHAYAEYLEPCTAAEGSRSETVRTVDGVDVTTLELGRGTSRRSYLERMSSLTVFGAAPDAALARYVANRRAVAPPAAACVIEDEPSVVRSPRRPYAGGAMRLIWVGEHAPAETAVSLTRDDGRRIELEVERIDGPPYGLVARWPNAEAGLWTAWFGDGERRLACENILVEDARSPYVRPVTSARNAHTPELEALWSIFVRELFDYPIDDRTWPNLQELLRDPARNLLFDHFTADEESRIALEPDCADLPFVLRAYFAWKVGVPFAVRSCSRGGEGRPPACSSPTSNIEWIDEEGLEEGPPIEGFRRFATSVVANTVHSASLRTVPSSDATDLYPVPLTREALRPGTVYADPYGHVMMIVRWVPADEAHTGMLIAADAQPDGTIGRPRFWRGTFLFTPDTTEVGAGFKAFRPIERRGDHVRQTSNANLRHHAPVPYSTAQYEGDVDAFYDRVEALIDPQPLDPETRLVTLVEALHDSARRRTVSVDNAEAFVRTHPGQTIPMPLGVEIFQTEGAWEDYSTPSRDMRLLLALDTVLAFPDAVRRRPERFGLAPDEVDAAASRLRDRLERELAAKTFEYVGTGGVRTTLSLADLRARIHAFEVGYDPNDCPEVRWGAPEGSAERARCVRRAPNDQRARLESYRAWFRDRRRPVR